MQQTIQVKLNGYINKGWCYRKIFRARYPNLSQLKAKIHIKSTAGLVSKVQQSTPKEN